MIDGVFQYQDSNGGGGLITDGDTQSMTAGAASRPVLKRPPAEI
jgi:redox-sensitive bicupin YhaK (pirin superfamily)